MYWVHASLVVPRAAARRSPVVPRAAARRSQVVPQSKQLGSQARRRRAEQAAGQTPDRRCRAHEEVRGPASGRAQEGRRRAPERGQRISTPLEESAYGLSRGVGSSTSRTLGLTDPFFRALRSLAYKAICDSVEQAARRKLADEINQSSEACLGVLNPQAGGGLIGYWAYGWIPHNAGFGFLDRPPAILGQIHF